MYYRLSSAVLRGGARTYRGVVYRVDSATLERTIEQRCDHYHRRSSTAEQCARGLAIAANEEATRADPR